MSNQKPQEVGSKDTGKDMTCRKGRVSDVDGMQGWWQELPSWERRVGGLRETGETGVSARLVLLRNPILKTSKNKMLGTFFPSLEHCS